VRLPLHSPLSSKCEKGKAYNEKMQFVHTIIQNIYKTETLIVEFLRRRIRGWSSNEQTRPPTTSTNLMYIEKLEKDEGVEQRFVKA
jgi:hypothetical protein